jgi:hypothetical protein
VLVMRNLLGEQIVVPRWVYPLAVAEGWFL